MSTLSAINVISQRKAIVIFAVFAFAYFLSALIRAITGTLAPTLVLEFALNAGDLGLLAGGYFLGFALTQLPLGHWLDQWGPKRVLLGFLSMAVLACAAFALAKSFTGLLAARVLCGVGVSACLMAPLSGYRRWYAPANQMRANSWMLMVGSFGMVAATLPVQWLMPLIGWRAIFFGLAALVALAMVLIAWQIPAQKRNMPQEEELLASNATPSVGRVQTQGGYAHIWRHPYFRKMAPLGFFNFGGMVAMQTLWAAPWMINVAGYSPAQAAGGLFWINSAMLATFWLWGLANPWLARKGLSADRLITYGIPLSLVVYALLVGAGVKITGGSAWMWVAFCTSATFGALAQPAVGLAFASHMAGRALAAFNLVIFSGIFVVQWGIGLLIDGFGAMGLAKTVAYQAAFGVYGLCCLGAYLFFCLQSRHNQDTSAHPITP
jgi:predicted MFS family arabinose efflux permease